MGLKTTDLCDKHPEKITVAEPIGFKDYGGKKLFHGEIVTLKCFEKNPLVRSILETDGTGKVLVVDGGASMRCAMLGDMLGEEAFKNKWNGIIVYGCVRDSADLANIAVGVKALNTHPLKSGRDKEGTQNIPVHFAGITFTPGEYVYCDEDGIIVSTELLAL
jgi:regulator of ribonuclease activity A